MIPPQRRLRPDDAVDRSVGDAHLVLAMSDRGQFGEPDEHVPSARPNFRRQPHRAADVGRARHHERVGQDGDLAHPYLDGRARFPAQGQANAAHRHRLTHVEQQARTRLPVAEFR